MSVNTTGVAITYSGDGSSSSFAYPNYLFAPQNLQVQVTTNAGVTTQYTLNAQPGFTFTGTADEYGAFPTGGTISLQDGSGNPLPAPAGSTLLITRITPKTQQVSFIDNDPFPASTVEHALDKLTLMAQEQTMFLGLSSGLPPNAGTVIGSWYQNATPVPGSNFGWVWTGTAWQPFGMVSL